MYTVTTGEIVSFTMCFLTHKKLYLRVTHLVSLQPRYTDGSSRFFNRAFNVVNITFVSTSFYNLASFEVMWVLRVLELVEALCLPQHP